MNVTCHSIALACWRKWRNGGPAPSTKHPAPSTQRKVRNAKVSASAQSTIDQSKKNLHIVHQIQRPAPGPPVKETKCAVTGSTKYQTPCT